MEGRRVGVGVQDGQSEGASWVQRRFGKVGVTGISGPWLGQAGGPEGTECRRGHKGGPSQARLLPQLCHPSPRGKLPEAVELPDEQPAEALRPLPWWAGSPTPHHKGRGACEEPRKQCAPTPRPRALGLGGREGLWWAWFAKSCNGRLGPLRAGGLGQAGTLPSGPLLGS